MTILTTKATTDLIKPREYLVSAVSLIFFAVVMTHAGVLDSGSLAPTLPPSTKDIAAVINPLCDQQSTAAHIAKVMEEYRATIIELEHLRWRLRGEDDSGEKYYRMNNPNAVIDSLTKR